MDKETRDFNRIVVEDIPLIDLRAPVEFEAGGFPTAVNLPILDDKQRHLVGICYKEKGQDTALNLGHQLVQGELKKSRIEAWMDFLQSRPDAVLYCFRGGKRSQIAQQWLEERSGKEIPRLSGGYKALRKYLLEQLDPLQLRHIPVVLGGRTGSGKTLLLQQFENTVDLEALANHRGSSFGRLLTPQPRQTDFENRLAWELIQHNYRGHRQIFLEDEGRHVGRCYIPQNLAEYFSSGSFILLKTSLQDRIEIIFDEYVTRGQKEYRAVHGDEEGNKQWFAAMNDSIDRIRKRLGGEREGRVKRLLASAYLSQQHQTDPQGHRHWIKVLMCEYYDPMYDYQLKKNNRPIVFQGDATEVTEFLRTIE